MRLLLVSATVFEVAPTLAQAGYVGEPGHAMDLSGSIIPTPLFDCLVTGVGQLQCAVHVTRALASGDYDCVIQAGIAGSFSEKFAKRAVVMVEEECLADVGAEDNGSFLDLVEMGLLSPDRFPFKRGRLCASRGHVPNGIDVPFVRSATVNRVLSEPHSIQWVRDRYAPDIVNMEGAALFHSCLLANIPFMGIRAISDMVGPRDKSSWDIPGAINALNEVVGRVIVMLRSAPVASC